MRLNRLILSVFFLITVWEMGFTQFPGQLLFHHLTNEGKGSALSQTSNFFIFKDSKGFVWISSLTGLNRFDGKNIKIYETIPGDSTALYGQDVQGEFVEDEKSNIWFTTYSALHYYNRKQDNFQQFFLKDSLGISIAGFYNCGIDSNKRLWLIYNDSLYTFDTIKKKIYSKNQLLPNINRGQIQYNLYGHVKRFFAYSRRGSGFLAITDPESNSPFRKQYFLEDYKNELTSVEILDIFPATNSLIWIATDKGLIKFNLFTENVEIFDTFNRGKVGTITGIAPYTEEYLAISSLGQGLLFFSKNEEKFVKRINSHTSWAPSLSSDFLGSVYVDKNNGIWLTIDRKGVDYTYPSEVKFNNYLTIREGGNNGNLISFKRLLDAGKAGIWASTYTKGIFILNDKKRIVDRITKESEPKIPSNGIIHLFKDNLNRIWILTWGGLSFYDIERHHIRQITGEEQIFLYGLQSKNGRILFSSLIENGIWEMDEDFSFKRIDQTGDSKYTFLYEDRENQIYGCNNLTTLTVFKNDSILKVIKNLPFIGDIKAAYEPTKNDSLIWFATTNGLIKLNKYTYDFRVFSRKDGLPSSTIYAVVPDEKGNIWLSTNAGIACFNSENYDCQTYGLMDGLSALEFNTFSYLKRSDNEIWFGSSDGLTTFYPEKIQQATPPPIQITEILINDEIWPDLKCQKTGSINPGEIEEIKVEYFQNTLSFAFSALEYANPENVRLKYKMMGKDENWVEARKDGFVRYSKMIPGTYSFQVKSSNSTDVWSKQKSIDIIIQSPFYKTWWFILACFVLITCVVWRIIYTYQKRKKKLQKILEKQRDQFGRDMHAELGSSLSSLSLLIELVKRKLPSNEVEQEIEKIALSTQKLSHKVREVIWAVNSRNDTLEKLIGYLHKHALESFENTKIECFINIPDLIPLQSISGKHRNNMLFSYKEAIDNIINHSEASLASIVFVVDVKFFKILIQDNGIGFPPLLIKESTGNGLMNIQDRMNEIGGECKIQTSSDGTTIMLSLKRK